MKTIDWNALAKQAHKNSVDKGFWKNELSNEHCLMLVITEISEAVEADRKGRRADAVSYKEYLETVWPDFSFPMFEKYIKDTVEDELADAAIRLLDFSGSKGWNIFERVHTVPNVSMTEASFSFIKFLLNDNDNLEFRINRAVSYLRRWSKELGFDLGWHIEQKMKYNALREPMHGKKY